MMAELCGRETGYCHGRGGSMHIADVQKGNLGATASSEQISGGDRSGPLYEAAGCGSRRPLLLR